MRVKQLVELHLFGFFRDQIITVSADGGLSCVDHSGDSFGEVRKRGQLSPEHLDELGNLLNGLHGYSRFHEFPFMAGPTDAFSTYITLDYGFVRCEDRMDSMRLELGVVVTWLMDYARRIQNPISGQPELGKYRDAGRQYCVMPLGNFVECAITIRPANRRREGIV